MDHKGRRHRKPRRKASVAHCPEDGQHEGSTQRGTSPDGIDQKQVDHPPMPKTMAPSELKAEAQIERPSVSASSRVE